MKPTRQPGMIFILITLFIDIVGIGIVIYAAPFILPGAPFSLSGLLFLAGLVVTVQLFRRILPSDLPPMPEAKLDEKSL